MPADAHQTQPDNPSWQIRFAPVRVSVAVAGDRDGATIPHPDKSCHQNAILTGYRDIQPTRRESIPIGHGRRERGAPGSRLSFFAPAPVAGESPATFTLRPTAVMLVTGLKGKSISSDGEFPWLP